jgi:protein-S-isoprenylcysteine O-methyltransferase Ste14
VAALSLAERLQRGRVPLGWIFAAAFLVFARPRPGSILGGATLVAAGAAFRTWASGHIRKREALAVSGPYAHTRNPLYFGSFLMAAGALVMGWNPWLAAAFLLFAVPVYHVVMRKEEEFLAGKFGAAFTAYERAVPRFFPRPHGVAGGAGAFDWGLVRRHGEWRTWLGAAALTAVLCARYLWGR